MVMPLRRFSSTAISRCERSSASKACSRRRRRNNAVKRWTAVWKESFMLASSQNAVDHRGHAAPTFRFLLKLPASRPSERIILSLAIVLRNAPFGDVPPALLEAQQSGIQSSLVQLQQVFRHLLNAQGDSKAVHGSHRIEGLEHQQIKRSLQHFSFGRGQSAAPLDDQQEPTIVLLAVNRNLNKKPKAFSAYWPQFFQVIVPSFSRSWYGMGFARRKVMPRVLIVDDSDIFRRRVRAILESRPRFEVCGEADNGEDAARLAQELRPDAMVVDISLRGINGIEATRTVRAKLPDAKIVVMSLHVSKELVEAIKAAGASGYVLKSRADPDLVDAINAADGTEFYISPAIRWEAAKGA